MERVPRSLLPYLVVAAVVGAPTLLIGTVKG